MSQKALKIVLAAAGTAGHVMPGLSIARALSAKYEVIWLGANGLETQLLASEKFPLYHLKISGLRGKAWYKLLLAPILISLSLWQALRILHQQKPALLLAMGGFVSVPAGLAAKLLGIPLVLHEQNAIPGTANKLLSLFANKILGAYPEVFAKKYICTGNPLRPELSQAAVLAKESKLRVLVLGGSLGAFSINKCLTRALNFLDPNAFLFWHQTGAKTFAQTQKLYAQEKQSIFRLEPFIEDMASAYAWADLVIARAGALTISELALMGLPSILIPYPHAVDNHQYFNAKYLSDKAAAVLLEEKDLNPHLLASFLNCFASERSRLALMANLALQLAKPAALEACVAELEAILGKKYAK